MNPTIGLFPDRRHGVAPPVVEGLTPGQSGELVRLRARYGRCTYHRQPSGHVVVALVGDDPAVGSQPVTVQLDPTGRAVGARPGSWRRGEAS